MEGTVSRLISKNAFNFIPTTGKKREKILYDYKMGNDKLTDIDHIRDLGIIIDKKSNL